MPYLRSYDYVVISRSNISVQKGALLTLSLRLEAYPPRHAMPADQFSEPRLCAQ